MRRENRKHIKKQTNDKVITYGMIGAAILVIAIISILTFINKNKSEKTQLGNLNLVNNTTTENTESASTELGKTVNEVQEEATSDNATNATNSTNTNANNTIANNINTITKNVNKNTNTSKATTKTNSPTTTEKKNEPTFMKPVEGEISKEFAKDQLVYSDTLEEWTTHLGIDIKAQETTVVVASEAGTVKSIKNDPRYGLTITIEHEDGYQTVYSNLLTSEFVVENEKVEKGQTIGTVGNTAAFETKDDAHLHFEILKDFKQVDPTIYIK